MCCEGVEAGTAVAILPPRGRQPEGEAYATAWNGEGGVRGLVLPYDSKGLLDQPPLEARFSPCVGQ